jgi:DNA ligase (NAD+)
MKLMEDLIHMLNEASKAYYNGESTMTDIEYDKLFDELKSLEERTGLIYSNSPTQKVGATVLDHLTKKTIDIQPMLSLDKVHSAEEVVEFAKKKTMVAMLKCDGLSVRLIYKNGKLESANTRGDGEVGVDITEHIKQFQNVPLTIPKHKGETLIVDGEAIIKLRDFELINKNGQFKNSRNTAAGTLNSLDTSVVKERRLSFIAWDIIGGIVTNSMERKLLTLNEFGFEIVPFGVVQGPTIEDVDQLNKLLPSSQSHDIPSDGVVWKYDDLDYGKSLGRTSHHFNWAVAWKPEIETFETKLVNIDWTMGRTGVLTPVAVFEPVDDGESVITRASLHNLSVMEDTVKIPYYGQKLEIYKANMIIPQILSADKDGFVRYEIDEEGNERTAWVAEMIPLPEECPVCGGMVKIAKEYDTKTLVCINTLCEGKLVNRLDHFAGKKGLDIKGLSKATLDKLIEWGWVNEPADLYKLADHRDEWIQKTGFGVKSVDNILSAIEDSRHPTLDQFISSLGIPLIGKTVSKDLLDYIESYEDLKEKAISKWDFTKIDGFAYSKANAIWSFDFSEADRVREFMEFTVEEKVEVVNNLEDVTIVITGKLNSFKNRAELQEVIESRGGKVVGSVSKNTKYLINNDTQSNSSKNVTAKKLGIPIISEEEFKQKFLT